MFWRANPTRRPRLWQFRLSTLLVAMAVCAFALAVSFAILPRYVDDWRVVSGQVLIHLTPAAQELIFDPPAPMGPMHETKVIVLSTLGYDVATALAVTMLVVWSVSRWRRSRMRKRIGPSLAIGQAAGERPTQCNADEDKCSATTRIYASLAGGLTGTLVGGVGFALLLRSLSGVPHAALVGCVVGAIAGTVMARRGIEPACAVAGCTAFVFGALGTIVLYSL